MSMNEQQAVDDTKFRILVLAEHLGIEEQLATEGEWCDDSVEVGYSWPLPSWEEALDLFNRFRAADLRCEIYRFRHYQDGTERFAVTAYWEA